MRERASQPVAETGPEWFKAQCAGCSRTWSGKGTIDSRRQRELAQKHADRTGHSVSAEHANRR